MPSLLEALLKLYGSFTFNSQQSANDASNGAIGMDVRALPTESEAQVVIPSLSVIGVKVIIA